METNAPQAQAVRDPDGLSGIRWDATKDEYAVALAIARIGAPLVRQSVLETAMDILAVHLNGNPLDLDGLLKAAPGVDFAHDLAGIARHIDRTTGKLRDCFRPRYSVHAWETI